MPRDVVDTLADAKAGDTVWLFDEQRSNYVDGHYRGRGVWMTAVIDDENRASFIIQHQKYDRKTGVCRPKSGYSPRLFIFGKDEREHRLWQNSSYRLSDAVKTCKDVEKLKQIAEILGWQP